MKYQVIKKHNNSDMCVVCGYKNPFSLNTQFYEVQGEYIVGLTQGKEEHQSYPNRMHGGLISALLDEAIGRAIQIKDPDMWGVTGDLNVKFRKPVPFNSPLKVVGWITKETSRAFVGEGFIEDDQGTLLATGSATYIKIPLDKIVADQNCEVEWVLLPDSEPPQYIDINNIK